MFLYPRALDFDVAVLALLQTPAIPATNNAPKHPKANL